MSALKPYQSTGAIWLYERDRALLADDPGLGKTRTALAAAALRDARRVLVLGPAIARAVWEREWDVMFRMFAKVGGPHRLMFTSYQKFVVSDEERDKIAAYGPDVVILDEFHYLKHLDSQRTRMILGSGGDWSPGAAVWGLSGTPIPRNPLELYPIVRAFWPDEMRRELGITTMPEWRDRFTVWFTGPAPYFRVKVVGARNVPELRAFLRGKMLRRRDRDALPDLPPIRWTEFPMSLPPRVASEAHAIEDSLSDLEREQLLLQGAYTGAGANTSRARHALGDLKAPLAAQVIKDEMLRESEGSKRIVFAYHRSVLDVLAQELHEFGLVRVDGSANAQQRAAREHMFQTFSDIRVFLGQTEAAGLSITLTASHRVDLVEPDWRTDMNVQAGKRAHRIGQEQKVWVRMFSMADTLDEAIVRQHWREVEMVRKVVD